MIILNKKCGINRVKLCCFCNFCSCSNAVVVCMIYLETHEFVLSLLAFEFWHCANVNSTYIYGYKPHLCSHFHTKYSFPCIRIPGMSHKALKQYILYTSDRIKNRFMSIAIVFGLILFLCNFQSEVFAVAFALLAAGAVILTLNVLLLVKTIFSLSLLHWYSITLSCFKHYILFWTMQFSGRTYNIFPKPKPFGLLSISTGRWSSDLHVERQCDTQNDRCVCDSCLEFLGGLSFHERSCEPEKKSSCTLPGLPHVCLCWFLDHCHWLIRSGKMENQRLVLWFSFEIILAQSR